MSPPVVGNTISHYRILDELGRGGMGVVYRALDTRLGREVALKFLPEEVAGDEAALTRFRREARAASALNHPNICTLFDIGEHEGRHFIAMELLRGQSLADRLQAGPLPMAEVYRIGAQLAGALETSHAQGILHRDVKPRNVFLTDRGDAKLLDFGLAKAAPSTASSDSGLTLEADLTQEQRVVGTPSYMSPEQALGRPLDGRSDLFSLGGVLYCMATGRRPFEAEGAPAILDAVLHSDPPRLTAVNPEASAALERVVARCLQKQPRARYAGASELRQDLERLAAGSSVSQPLREPWSSQRRLVAALVGAVVLAGVVVAGFSYLRGRDRDGGASAIPVVAVLPFSNQTGDPAKAYLGQALSAGLQTELGELRALTLVSPGMLGADRDAAMRRAIELGAQILVEGDLREAAADQLRIDARVTDARSGLVLWTRSFEGGVEELLRLEGRMARGLASFLSIPLSSRERSRLGRGSTDSLEAMRLYAEGMIQLEGAVTGPGPQRAIQAFESAIRLDDRFALGYAALSQARWQQHEDSGGAESLDLAIAAAERAVAIDPELPQAQLALALVRSAEGGEGEVGDVASILARHPSPAAAHRELGLLYERVERFDDAERSFREATAIDPDDWFNWNRLGVFLFRHRDLAAAKVAFEKACELATPGVTRPWENLGALAIQASEFDEAIELLERLPPGSGDGATASSLGTAYFFSNRPDKWEKAEKHYLEAVARDPQRSEYRGNLADVYAAIGNTGEALLQYREAMALAEREARQAPGDTDARLLVALYAAKGRECDQGLALAGDLRPKAAASSQRLHNLALVYSLCRDRDGALDALEAAIELGLPPRFPSQEEEFQWLADDPSFIKLVGAMSP